MACTMREDHVLIQGKKVKRRVSFADDLLGKGNQENDGDSDASEDLEHRSKPFFNVIISCSPDKLSDMRNLERNIIELGYTTKVMSFTENSVARVDSDVVIAALSLRYTKSPIGSKEVTKTIHSGRPVIPLLLDNNVAYPTPELKDQSKATKPVDCRSMKPRADWSDTRELDEVIDRLHSVLPNTKGNSKVEPDKHSSNVPLAPNNNHVRSVRHRRVASDLAREASEITIRVRPPTPEHIERSRGPLHSSAPNLLNQDGWGDDSSENGSDDYDDDDGRSTDSETEAAKSMQNDYKLPPVSGPMRAVPLTHHPQHHPSTTTATTTPAPPRRPAQQQQSQPAAPRQPVPVRRVAPSQPPPRRTHDWDNKLPSVYRRKRIATTSY